MSMKLQYLHDYVVSLIVKYGITDEEKLRRLAYRKALALGMCEDLQSSKKVVTDIRVIINDIKRAARKGGEPFDKVTLEVARERLREVYKDGLPSAYGNNYIENL